MRCLVELHFPNFFGQCLNARIFVKRRFLLYLCFTIFVIIWIVDLMKSVLVSTRRENLTISPVTTPYLDRIVSFESWFGKLGRSDSGAPATVMKSVFRYKVRRNRPCLMLIVSSRKLTLLPSSPSIWSGLSMISPFLFKSDIGKIPSSLVLCRDDFIFLCCWDSFM